MPKMKATIGIPDYNCQVVANILYKVLTNENILLTKTMNTH